MNQNIINQMKRYQHKKEIVKAVQYQEGMEDGWMILLPDMLDGDDFVNRVFNSKDEAERYTTTSAFYDYKDYDIVPVMLSILADDEVETCSHVVSKDMLKYEFKEIDSDDWIGIDEIGAIHLYYDFLDDYEEISLDNSSHEAKIGYDSELESIYVEFGNRRIDLERSEIATIEKVLEGFNIPYTEKLGQLFRYED